MSSTNYRHIHFLGIAGIGVSALAQLVLARSHRTGTRVSGTDPNALPEQNPAIARLLAGGATLYTTHLAENLAPEVDLVVVSAAVQESNPEVRTARERGIPLVSRAEFLGNLMAAHAGPKIAVAGTHGKTTTTGMIGVMLQEAGLEPTVFVGGEVPELGGNLHIGSENGPFIAEACEAYDSFLHLKPDFAVITNIEADHLDHYGDLDHLLLGFQKFVANIPLTGSNGVIGLAEDPNIVELMARITAEATEAPLHFYSYSQNASVTSGTTDNGVNAKNSINGIVATDVFLGKVSRFHWSTLGHLSESYLSKSHIIEESGEVELLVPGRHNISNGLAAVQVGLLLGLDSVAIAQGLKAFRGATRRQDMLGSGYLSFALDSEQNKSEKVKSEKDKSEKDKSEKDKSKQTEADSEATDDVLVMDDYAHHPTEITATLEALRSAYPDRRIVATFQPHLFSRTRDFLEQFARSLTQADVLLVTDIYPAREAPIPGIHAARIVELALQTCPTLEAHYIADRKAIPGTLLAEIAHPGDLCLFLGAGDIREQAEEIYHRLHQR